MKLKKNQLKRTKNNPKSTKLVCNSGYKIMIILYIKQIRKNYEIQLSINLMLND